ncbi:hypothetical protein [Liquorilactobacillus mali]|uniref:hypothetical protein n=1 Tax=Liquorilactobacillus mali TaxID=1618 RepID=UPI002954AA91|nr:hypothetical protein [Liquorilactobacillus mali]MDV7757566.1 hypothetical protein [Liquorilactobacillus mali]
MQYYGIMSANIVSIIEKSILFFLSLLSVLKIILKGIERKYFYFLSIFLLISVMNLLFTKDATFLNLFIMYIIFSDFTVDEITRIFFRFNLIALIIILPMHYFGLLPSVETYNDNLVKYSLGFSHPNSLGITLLIVNICFVYLSKNRLKLLPTISLLFFDGILLNISQARTSLYLIILLFLLWIIFNKFNRKILFELWAVGSFFLSIFLFFLTYIVNFFPPNNSYYFILNNFFSGRLDLIQFFFNKYGVTFFGQQIHYELILHSILNYSYEVLDNSYAKLLVNYGIIAVVAYLGLIGLICFYSYRSKNKWMLIPVIIFLLLGFSEQSMLYFWCNFSLLFLMDFLHAARV